MTTRTTLLMEVVPSDGFAAWQNPGGSGYSSMQSTPPSTFGKWIPGRCPVRITHDGPTIGYIDYAEHSMGYGNGQMYAVATIEGVPADMIDGKVQASAEIRANAIARNVESVEYEPYFPYSFTGPKPMQYRMRKVTKSVGDMYASQAHLDGIALVDSTASLTSFRCRAWNGDYRSPADRGSWNMRDIPDVVKRAIEATSKLDLRYNRPSSIRINQPAHFEEDHDYRQRHGGRQEIQWTAPYSGGILEVRSA